MKRLLNGPAFLVAGLIMGVASAVVAVDSFGNSLVEAGSPWQGRAIPEVLMSGHHGRIADWRRDQSRRITRDRRPDLWQRYLASGGDGSDQ